GPDQPVPRHARPARPGHDRRGHVDRARPAGRRRPGEDPGGPTRRHQERAHPPAQREGPRRDPPGGQGRPVLPPGRYPPRRRSPRLGAPPAPPRAGSAGGQEDTAPAPGRSAIAPLVISGQRPPPTYQVAATTCLSLTSVRRRALNDPPTPALE